MMVVVIVVVVMVMVIIIIIKNRKLTALSGPFQLMLLLVSPLVWLMSLQFLEIYFVRTRRMFCKAST